MSLTSEQAHEMRARPRMSEEDEERAIALFADGCTNEEVQAQMPEWSVGTFANRKTGWKDRIAALRRARAVQMQDVLMVRQPARLNGYSDLYMRSQRLRDAQFRLCWIQNPDGELEFIGTLEGGRLLKIYADMVFKAGRLIAEETGDLRAVLDVAFPGLSQYGTLIEGEDGQFYGVEFSKTT